MPFIPDKPVGCQSSEHNPPFGLRGPGVWVCPDCGKRTRVNSYAIPKRELDRPYPYTDRRDWGILCVVRN
jgi:hypothetical protein